MHSEVMTVLSETLKCILVLAVTAVFLTIFCLQYDPQRAHARWLQRGITGLLLLLCWNLLSLPHLGVNPLSVMVTGALGLPGVGLMAVVNLLN